MCAIANSRSPLVLVLAYLMLASSMKVATANSFLRGKVEAAAPDMSLSAEQHLLDEMEKELGSNHRSFTNLRLQSVKAALQPLYKAMKKNAAGKLDMPAVNYVLRRALLDRHAWFVKGLEPESKSWAAFQDADPMLILRQQGSENVTGIFESRFKQGLDMNEIAVLLASLEHLVHKESYDRLAASYLGRNLTMEDALSPEEVSEVLDMYMSIYIVGPIISNVSTLSAESAMKVRGKIVEIYPSFPNTQEFVRDVQKSVMQNRDYFYLAEVMSVVDEMQDRYGRWQNKECLDLKNHLVSMEDQSVGGGGRVRLADFYDAALNKGRWEFCENVDYLRTIGALDDTDPTDLKLIIPNYINGPANCMAGSSYYSVCCIDECDSLLSHLEKALEAPEASPEQILHVVRSLPSPTVAADRTLAPWLVRRLEEVAEQHGGNVPLHGRLFSQWMHYAYPRECLYPHRLGEAKMQKGRDYKKETNKRFEATQEEMQEFIKQQKPGVYKNLASEAGAEEDDDLQCAMWTKDEELVVARDPAVEIIDKSIKARTFARCVMLLMFLGSVAKMLMQLAPASMSRKQELPLSTEKFFA